MHEIVSISGINDVVALIAFDRIVTVERIRDQVAIAPAGVDREAARTQLTRLEQRLVDVTDRAKRGAC